MIERERKEERQGKGKGRRGENQPSGNERSDGTNDLVAAGVTEEQERGIRMKKRRIVFDPQVILSSSPLRPSFLFIALQPPWDK